MSGYQLKHCSSNVRGDQRTNGSPHSHPKLPIREEPLIHYHEQIRLENCTGDYLKLDFFVCLFVLAGAIYYIDRVIFFSPHIFSFFLSELQNTGVKRDGVTKVFRLLNLARVLDTKDI